MNAMILAAGHGTRLRPLTDTLPKVLVPVLGVPMLERLRCWLARGGVTRLAMNTHHRAGAVRAHLAAGEGRPLVRLFHEPALLGTGGALRNAAPCWEAEPLLVWNGDILADVAPRTLWEAHAATGVLATLAVQAREHDSRLLVDAVGAVCGIDSARRGTRRVVGTPGEPLRPMAFLGISVLSPALRAHMPPGGAFGLIEVMLDAVAAGGAVRSWDVGAAFYGTTGTPQALVALEAGLLARPALLAAWTP